MKKQLLEKYEFLIGIFAVFFFATYLTDTQIYFTQRTVAIIHSLEAGLFSIFTIFLINIGNKKGFFK